MSANRDALIAALCAIVAETDPRQDVLERHTGVYRRIHRELEVGAVRGSLIRFDHTARQIIRHWLAGQGIDPAVGVPAAASGRTERAAYQLDEKSGAQGVAATHGLLALAGAGDAPGALDGVALSAPGGGFLVIPDTTGQDLAADWLLTVENYETFIALCRDPARLARGGRGVLVFRGSPSFPRGEAWAGCACARQGIAHWHAPDLDPQGLSHCLSEGRRLAGAWLPRPGALVGLAPNPALFSRQQSIWSGLRERSARRFPALLPWVELLERAQGGWTQERLFAADVPFVWLANSDAETPSRNTERCATRFRGRPEGM